MTMDIGIENENFIEGLCSFCLEAKTASDNNAINWSRLTRHIDSPTIDNILDLDATKEICSKYGCEFPLREICKKNPPAEVVAVLLKGLGTEKALIWVDEEGHTALHSVLDSCNTAPADLIRHLCTPETTTVACTRHKSTPLHVMCRTF
mmetsp:Transcript_3944/g.9079  ORF Transcript_3944/g.9079 Transcript_3944/m.9079 type:complete len:149 (+) Transcript_3944:39-485(+)